MIDFDNIKKTLGDVSPEFSSASGVVTYKVPKLDKLVGLKELKKAAKQAERNGIKATAYPTRGLSPSFLSRFYKEALGSRRAEFDSEGNYIPKSDDNPGIVFDYWLSSRDEKKASDAMILGQVAEDLICLGKRTSLLNWLPYEGRINNAITEQAEEEKRTPVKAAIWEKALAMTEEARKDSFMRVRALKRLQHQRRVEGTIKVGDELISLVCVPDIEDPERNRNVDIKTTLSLYEFPSKVWGKGRDSFHYWIQAAINCHLCGVEEFSFFVVQTKAPYFCDWFHIDAETVAELIEKVRRDVLVPFLYYYENGFKSRYIKPNRWF